MKIIPSGLLHNQLAPSQVMYSYLQGKSQEVVDDIKIVHESFGYIKNETFRNAITACGKEIMLTSGTYLSFALAEEYFEFIRKIHKHLAVTEDNQFMAGSFYVKGNQKISYEIIEEYQRRGVRLIPVIDVTMTKEYVDYYVNSYPTVILSCIDINAHNQPLLEAFFDKHLLDNTGKTKCKLHGTDLTEPLIRNFPWHSCDTSIWATKAKLGQINSPLHGVLTVSNKSSSIHCAGRHIQNLSEIEAESIKHYLGMNGFDSEEICESRIAQATFNLWALKQVEEMLETTPPSQTTTYSMELF